MTKGLDFDDVLIIPQFSNVESRTEPDVSSYIAQDMITQIPIIPANMDCIATLSMRDIFINNGGPFIHHRFVDLEDVKPGEFVTIGMRDCLSSEWKDRVCKITNDIGAELCIDIAHAHSKMVLNALKFIRSYNHTGKIIVSNIATGEAARDFCNEGASALKVGIGPGYSCTTRMVTGCGVPQITAIHWVSKVAKQFKVPVIADGGIKTSGDIAKAIAAGANIVMIGSLLAGTEEAGGRWFTQRVMASELGIDKVNHMIDIQKMIDLEESNPTIRPEYKRMFEKRQYPQDLYRQYWGQSSEDFQQEWYGGMKEGIVAEGETKYVPYSGSALDVVKKLLGGLKSSMTYVGAKTIKEFQKKAEFIEVNRIK